MKVLRYGWIPIVVLIMGLGLARLRFDVDALNLLPGDLPAVKGLQLHQRYFSNSRELLITLSGPDAEVLATEADQIAARLRTRPDWVKSVFSRPPWLDHPTDAAENLAWLWLQQAPADFRALSERLTPTFAAEQLARTRDALATSLDPGALARASYDPLNLSELPGQAAAPGGGFDTGIGTFQNGEGTFRVIYVEPASTNQTYRAAIRWLANVRSEIEPLRTNLPAGAPPSSVMRFTGGPVFLGEIASGMENDLTSSILTTVGVIGILFFIAHRSLRPMLWLGVALGVTLLGTLALGGLWFGTLNVLSAGFAAVLLGLVVDYGLVGYQEARAEPELSLSELRRRIAPGIGWSAVTTAGTFALLRWAGLPGLAQLGTLTALGLLLGAVVMVFGFLPLAVRGLPGPRTEFEKGPHSPLHAGAGADRGSHHRGRFGLWISAVLLAGAAVVLLIRGWPPATSGTAPLRPRQSAAYDAMERLQVGLGHTNEPAWLLFRGDSPQTVARQMADTETILAAAVSRGDIASYVLPRGFWPQPDSARTNLATAVQIVRYRSQLQRAGVDAGFTADALRLDDAVLLAWENWGRTPLATLPLWPTNLTANWLHQQFAARDDLGGWLALGLVTSGTRSFTGAGLPSGVLLSGWDRLGPELLERVSGRVTRLTLVIAGVLVGSLWLAFRRWSEVGLSLIALAAARLFE